MLHCWSAVSTARVNQFGVTKELILWIKRAGESVSGCASLEGAALCTLNIISPIEFSYIFALVTFREHSHTFRACLGSQDVLGLKS